MNFNGLNQSVSEETSKKEEIRKTAELVGELLFWSEKNHNPIIFSKKYLSEMTDSKFDLYQNSKIKDKVLEELDDYDRKIVEKEFMAFKSFVTCPIFTDSYGKDHYSRREWELNHLNELSKEALDYYKSNRLGINKCSFVISYLHIITSEITDSNLKKSLGDLEQEMAALFMNEDGNIKYNSLSDENKIEIVEKFTVITKEVVAILEESK